MNSSWVASRHLSVRSPHCSASSKSLPWKLFFRIASRVRVDISIFFLFKINLTTRWWIPEPSCLPASCFTSSNRKWIWLKNTITFLHSLRYVIITGKLSNALVNCDLFYFTYLKKMLYGLTKQKKFRNLEQGLTFHIDHMFFGQRQSDIIVPALPPPTPLPTPNLLQFSLNVCYVFFVFFLHWFQFRIICLNF